MLSSGTSATEHCLRKDMELGRSPDYYNGNKSQNNSSIIMYTTALQTLGVRWARYGWICTMVWMFKKAQEVTWENYI